MAIKIAKNIYRLPTLGSFINSYALINDDSSITLVDCGLKGSSKKLIKDLARIGKSLDFSRPFPAYLRQLFRSLPIDRAESVKTVVETTGFEPAPIAW